PTKIEGNPRHPNSLAATDTFAQASLLDLYDPDRSRFVLKNGQISSKDELLSMLDKLSADLKASGGKGLAIISEDFASPSIDLLRDHLKSALPQARFCVFEPSRFGEGSQNPASYDLSQAKTILSLDCDFLGLEDEGVTCKRAFADARNVEKNGGKMNRLYVVEPSFTITGTVADHRLRLPASKIGEFAEKLLDALKGRASGDRWIDEVASDLKNGGVVLVGARHADVTDVVEEINRLLG